MPDIVFWNKRLLNRQRGKHIFLLISLLSISILGELFLSPTVSGNTAEVINAANITDTSDSNESVNPTNSLETTNTHNDTNSAQVSSRGTVHLKVVTYNIRHGLGLDGQLNVNRIADELAQSQADVIAIQEVDRYRFRSGFQDQAAILARKLAMHACFAPSLKQGIGQYGHMILSRYPIECAQFQALQGEKETRSILTVRLKVAGETVTVVGTHLGVSEGDRQRQMPIVAETLAKLEQPAIVLGDFNMESNDPLMKQLTTQWTALDSRPKLPTVLNGREVDHIMVNMPMTNTSASVLASRSSDHRPVAAELSWSG